jgi:hypothetical protein
MHTHFAGMDCPPLVTQFTQRIELSNIHTHFTGTAFPPLQKMSICAQKINIHSYIYTHISQARLSLLSSENVNLRTELTTKQVTSSKAADSIVINVKQTPSGQQTSSKQPVSSSSNSASASDSTAESTLQDISRNSTPVQDSS